MRTNSYPGIDDLSFVPFSLGFRVSPSTDFQIVDLDSSVFGVSGVEEDFLVYTWIVFPSLSFFVCLNVYPEISFLSFVPLSEGLISLPVSSTYVVTTLR